ncbi:MAG: outer membrane beta-barrel protein [Pseudomonadota bacterium]
MLKFLSAALFTGLLTLSSMPTYAQDSMNGWYAGGFVGYGASTSRWTQGAVSTGDFSTDGMVAGLYGGRNWQRNKTVYGVELELGVTDIEGATQTNCVGCRTDIDSYGFVKARLGRDTGRGLIYGALGYGAASVTQMLTGSGHVSDITPGWQVGVGYEAPFQEGWNLRAEAAYMRFGGVSNTLSGPISVDVGGVTTLKLGLTQNF